MINKIQIYIEHIKYKITKQVNNAWQSKKYIKYIMLSLMYVNLLNVWKSYQHLNVLVQLFITDRG